MRVQTAKIFENGRSQAVRLPKQYRFSGSEVFIRKLGDVVMLIPKDRAWNTFLEGIDSFTDDFFESDREQGISQEREDL